MRKKIGLAVLLAALSGVASARGESCKIEHFLWFTFDVCTPDGGKGSTAPAPAPAPEVDPASAMTAFTLVLGGLVVLRSRRYKNAKA